MIQYKFHLPFVTTSIMLVVCRPSAAPYGHFGGLAAVGGRGKVSLKEAETSTESSGGIHSQPPRDL